MFQNHCTHSKLLMLFFQYDSDLCCIYTACASHKTDSPPFSFHIVLQGNKQPATSTVYFFGSFAFFTPANLNRFGKKNGRLSNTDPPSAAATIPLPLPVSVFSFTGALMSPESSEYSSTFANAGKGWVATTDATTDVVSDSLRNALLPELGGAKALVKDATAARTIRKKYFIFRLVFGLFL